MSTPPPDWYPDPSGAPHLRYWDGAAWTEHVAPHPTAQSDPAPRSEASPLQTAGQQEATVSTDDGLAHSAPIGGTEAAERRRAWNGGTWAVLAGGIVLVLLAAAGLVFAQTAAQARGVGEASEVAGAFIASAAGDDDAWRDLSSARLITTYLDRSPLRLDDATMEALEVEVEARTNELQFIRSAYPDEFVDERDADAAYMIVDLSYTWRAWDNEFTFSVPQQLWLTRPFYYGDGTPDRADAQRTPTAVGPWRATTLSYPQPSGANPGLGRAPARTDLQTTDRDGVSTCSSAGVLFGELSDSARTTGELRSSCWLREDGSLLLGDDVDLDALAAEFPLYGTSSIPDSAFRLRTQMEGQPLLAQYPIRTPSGEYLVTLGAASVGGSAVTFDDYHLRILSIQKAGS